MLNENIQALRKSRGLSQEELALKLNVVRQTVSKWERGLSVPDSEMLIALGEALDTSVSTLLGETVAESDPDDLKLLSEKLEIMNAQLANLREAKRRTAHRLFIAAAIGVVLIFAALAVIDSSYLAWDFTDPESAVASTFLHGFEWVFIRAAPFAFALPVVGAAMTRPRG